MNSLEGAMGPAKASLALNFLSIDILALVTRLLDGSHLCKLWITGNSPLQRRLLAPGVVESFRIVYASPHRFVWPSILRHFPHLVDLSLSQSFERVAIPLEHMDVRNLPGTLRRLDLDFASSFLALWSLVDGEDNTYDPIDIGKKFPDLELLRLHSVEERYLTRKFRPILSRLPATLNTLCLDTPPINSHKLLQSIPQSVTHLTVTIGNPSASRHQHFPILPSNLTYLDIQCDSTIDIDALPRTLKHLYIQATGSLEIDDPKFPPLLETFHYFYAHQFQWIPSLPTTITDLRLEILPECEWSRFSRLINLKSLFILSDSTRPALHADIHLLPPSITALYYASTQEDVVYTQEDLAKNSPNFLRLLGKFRLNSAEISASLSLLPKLLEYLNLHQLDRPLSDQDVEHLSTTKLRVLCAPLWKLTRRGWNRLRTFNLHTLQCVLGSRSASKSISIAETLSWDEEGHEMGSYRLPFLSTLPPTLTDLYIELPEHPIWEFSFADLVVAGLDKLKNLSISCRIGMSGSETSSYSESNSSESLLCWHVTCEPPAERMRDGKKVLRKVAKFPQSLEKFRTSNLSVSMDCVRSFFATNLKSMELERVGSETPCDEDLEQLPRTLTNLTITTHIPNRTITKKGLSVLPPSLISIVLPECIGLARSSEAPSVDLPRLPPYLRVCVFGQTPSHRTSWITEFVDQREKSRYDLEMQMKFRR